MLEFSVHQELPDLLINGRPIKSGLLVYAASAFGEQWRCQCLSPELKYINTSPARDPGGEGHDVHDEGGRLFAIITCFLFLKQLHLFFNLY